MRDLKLPGFALQPADKYVEFQIFDDPRPKTTGLRDLKLPGFALTRDLKLPGFYFVGVFSISSSAMD